MAKLQKRSVHPYPKMEFDEWKTPLFRILEGQENLLRVTSDFPNLGKLPALITADEIKRVDEAINIGPPANGAAVGIVVVVVVVAVAARPGGVPNIELLKAKLLDVYGPIEREALYKAVKTVQKSPDLIKITLGIDQKSLGAEFMNHLNEVETALR